MAGGMSLSFVYPLYNEIENLPRLLPETRRIAEGLATDLEVVLVDDGSTDGSGQFIDRLADEHPCVVPVHHARNRGLGAAIRTGLSSATKDLVLYMDSDFPVSVEAARDAIGAFSDDIDLLIGYRLGRAEGPRREIMSWTYNRLIRLAFGLKVRDVNFAFKLVRRSLLTQMGLRSEGSFIDAELLLEAARLGARVREVGLQYHPRTAGVSTAASSRVVLHIFREMSRYWRRRAPGCSGPARLIVNADDFGLRREIDLGVAEAFDRGIVTSASLVAAGESFEHAVALARARPALDLGVHLVLTEGRPVAPRDRIPSLVDTQGRFSPTWAGFLRRYAAGRVRPQEVEVELRAQIERSLSTGLPFSHLDSHQHLHMLPRILPVVIRLASEYGMAAIRCPRQSSAAGTGKGVIDGVGRRLQLAALRSLCRLGKRALRGNGILTADDFRGFAEAGRWHVDALVSTIEGLGPGLTEVGCHPGADDAVDRGLGWDYRWEQELAALASSEVAGAVARSGVDLTTYREVLSRRGRAVA
jgi:hopanoid biosynthesis associated protein HpnK